MELFINAFIGAGRQRCSDTERAAGAPGAYKLRKTISTILGPIAVLAILSTIYMAFLYAPTEKVMGDVQRIFYFHVSSAIMGFLAFFVTFAASIVYLINRNRFADMVAACSTEIGVMFCLVVLTTGPIWAKPVWGAYWTWDPRLVTTLILLFIYAGYLMLRSTIEEETKRARFSAVVGIIGFCDVPIVYKSIDWWSRTIHPKVIELGKKVEIRLQPDIKITFFVAMAAMFVFFVFLLLKRIELEELSDQVKEMRKKVLTEI